jgi:hypothetical protein
VDGVLIPYEEFFYEEMPAADTAGKGDEEKRPN